MKIAFCLYGQPRHYNEGFINIDSFIKRNNNIEVDFYYHTWVGNENQKYKASSWSKIPDEFLKIDKNIIYKLNELYKPRDFCFDNVNDFDLQKYKNSIFTMHDSNEKDEKNVLSQCYSRNQVRNLLLDNIKKNNIEYRYVITCRFDFLKPITIDLNNINPDKIYVANLHLPRKIFPDNFMILSTNNYLKLFNISENLDNILHNEEIRKKVHDNDEVLAFIPEVIIFVCFLHYFDDFSNVIYTDQIPDFR